MIVNRDRMVKSKVKLIISYYEKMDGGIQKIDEKILNISGKEFLKSFSEEKEKGIEHRMEVVNETPERFQFGIIYLRADGKKAWINQLNG